MASQRAAWRTRLAVVAAAVSVPPGRQRGAEVDPRPGAPPSAAEAPIYLERIMLKSDGRTVFLSVDDIKWIGAAGERRGVADEWVTQLLRQGDAKVFKKYSQMKLHMKREALQKLNRAANEVEGGVVGQAG